MADVVVEKKPSVSLQLPQSIIKRGITPDVLRRSRSRRSRSVTPFLARQDRETTPFEIGQNVPHTLVSALCVLDKALVMDISSEVEDDPVQVLTSDFSVIDRACVVDISLGDFVLEYEEYEEEIADDASIMSVDDRASEMDDSETRSERSESEAPGSETESIATDGSEAVEGGEPDAKKKKVAKKKAVKKAVIKKKIVKKEESPKKKGKAGATPPPKAPPKKLAVSSKFSQPDSAPKPPKPTKPQPKKKSKSPSPRPKGAPPTKSAEEAAELAKKAREPSKEKTPEEEAEEEEEGEEGEEEEEEEQEEEEYQYDAEEEQEPEEEEEKTPKSPSPIYTEEDLMEQSLISRLTVYEADYDPDIWRKVTDEPPPPPIHLEFPPEKPRKGAVPYRKLTEKERDIEWQKEREAKKPPTLLNHLTDRTVCEGTPVKLSCSVSGPDLTAKWLRNGYVIEKKPTIKTTATEGYLVLELLNPTPLDSGVYECVVKNKNGELSSAANITVYQLSDELHVIPTIIAAKDSYDIYTDELIVEFHIRGQPRPQLEWAKDAIAIDTNDPRYRVVHEGNICQLLISKPTINDSGKYVCFASNAAGKIEASHTIYFESKEAVTHVAGIFHAHSKKSLDEITEELMPHITLPPHEPLVLGEPGERVKKEKPAAKGVKGGPKAAAAAAAGGKRRKEETLLHKKILSFANNLHDRTTNVGTKLKLTTTVIGPEPQIKWTKDGIGIAPSPRFKNSTKESFACIELSDLTLDDSGVYTCTAKNAAGEISTSANVTVYAIEDVDAVAPIFTLPIRDTYHAAENDLILSCKVRAHPRATIVWLKDEVEIPPSDRIQQVQHASGVCELLIHAPSTKDSGTYSCNASNFKGMQKVTHRTLVEAQAVVPVELLPREDQKPKRKMGKKKEKKESTGIPNARLSLVFQSYLTSRTVKEGQPVKLSCFVSGPEPNAKWMKDGAGFAPSPVIKVNNADGFLTCQFLSPKVEDSGEYSVLVKNAMSQITCSCRLDVYSANITSDFPPMFTRALKDNYHINTNELVIDGHIRGQPMPSVSWMKDGQIIDPDGTLQQFEHEDGTIEFVISDPQRSHSGRYICQLENHMGKAELSHFVLFEGREVYETEPVHGVFHVDHQKIREKEEAERRAREEALAPTVARRISAAVVEEEAGSADTSPRKTVSKTPSRLERAIHDAKTKLSFAAPLTNRVCAAGSKVKLSCYVEGHNPHFVWFKNNSPVNYSTRVRNSSRDGLGILEFFDAQIDDTGEYKCVVKNIAGEINSTATLMVYEDRKDVEVPPTFVIGLKDRYIVDRDEILLECHVRGDPEPKITWLREGEPLRGDRFQAFELPDGICHLVISKPVPKDSGVFACIAENKLSTVQTAHYLVFEGREAELKKLEPEPEPESKEPPKKKPLGKKAKARAAAKAAEAGAPIEMKNRLSFVAHLADRTVPVGGKLKLFCIVNGPEPQLKWTKDGCGIVAGPRVKNGTKENNGLIDILSVLPEDAGEWTCQASNAFGKISTTCNVTVFAPPPVDIIPPTFSRPIADTYNINVDELVLECRVRGQPRPTITWYKNGEEIDTHMSKRYEQQDSYDGFCRLLINKPTPADNGMYICKADNPGHSDKIQHYVQFTGKDQSILERTHGFYHRDPNKPHFSTVLTDNLVPVGGTIGLQVEVHGPVDVQWLRGREPLTTGDKVKTYAEEGVYTLAVTNASPKETGTYTCRATNAFGKSDTIAHVDVIAPATVKGGKPPQIHDRPLKEMVLMTGDNLKISFRITGDPKPQLYFLKGLRDLSKNSRTYKEKHDDYVRYTLERCLLQDSGTYCVMARNRFGVDRAFVAVQVKARAGSISPSREWSYTPITVDSTEVSYFKNPPEPIPAEPLVVDSGKNHVSLSWLKPPPSDAAPVIAYKVEAWLVGKDGGARWAELGVTPINSFDAFNLQQRCEYHFRVTPRNRYGWGPSVQTSHPVLVGVPVQMPEFTKILPGQLKALTQKDITLECIVKGHPKPDVIWYKDGLELETEDRISCRSLGSVCKLTILSVRDTDSARYTCEATNRAGRVSTFARLLVVDDPKIFEADNELKRNIETELSLVGEMQPQFTMRLRDRRVQVTFPVRLTCQCVGLPLPEVVWYRNGKEVEQNDRFNIWNDNNFYTLEIQRSTLDDGGRYTVTASNGLGSVSCHCNLIVDKGIRAYIAPDFYCGLDPLYTFSEGSEIRLSGQVEAYPSVGITWHRDGTKLRPSRRILATLDHNGFVELVIADAKTFDAGVYSCVASNAVGQAESCCRVVIERTSEDHAEKQVIPKITEGDYPYSKEPMFITKPRSSEAYEGDTVIIHCEVIGDPKPDVVWLRDFLKPEYYKDAPHFHRVGDGPEYRLEIPRAKLDYTGTYSVIATNFHGEAKAIISLQIYAKDLDKVKNMDKGSIKHSNVETLPSFLSHLKDLRCCDGDAVTLECRVIGKPEPNIFWEKDGRLLQMGNDFSSKYDGEKATLSLTKVFPEDEGSYTCIASNTIGKTYSSAVLIVDVPEEKENLLSKQLSRPPGILLSAQSTPRSTPRTTPIRSSSPRQMSFRSPCIDITSSKHLKFSAPKFFALPQNRVAEEGENVRFQCAIAGHPTPWATWDMNGTIVTPTARITIKECDDLRILEIEQVTQEDAGLYRITLENDFGRIEATARLDVICCRNRSSRMMRTTSSSPRRAGVWTRRLMGNSTAIGGRLALACDFRRGTSTPARKFYHNGEEVQESERVKIVEEENRATLIVDGVSVEDEGIYTCVVHADDSILTTSKTVTFSDNPVNPPQIVKPLTPEEAKDIRTSEGTALDLELQVECSEMFDYSWYRDDQVIVDSNDMRYIDHGDGILVLRIEDPFVLDSGVYRCVITSSVGKCETSCPVIVTETLDESFSASEQQLKPHFSKPPLPVVSHLGAEVAFSARISPPQSRISWWLNGREIGQDLSAHFQIEEEEDGLSILRVIGLKHDHSGEIKCVAQTRADCGSRHDTQAIAYTSLAVLPEVPPSQCPAHILSGPQDCTTLIGSRIVLDAFFAGHPDPTVKWMRAGRVISETPNKTMKTTKGQSVLVLTDITADDSGKYTVEVTNEHGGDVASASVAVEGPPDPPGGRPSVSQGNDRVAVAWCGPPYDGGCMITGFTIEIQEGESEWREIAKVVDSLAHTVKDLTPGLRYRFRVRAENTHGKSEPSLSSDEILIHSDALDAEKPQVDVEVASGGDFKSRFEMLEELGKGRFGVVYKVIERDTNRTLAAKVIKCIKSKDRVKVQEEISIMKSLKHPKLLQLAATFETTKEIIMVMEYITGGELFERVVADDFTLTERDCILFLRQICEGVSYMHEKCVVHLDLKPENIMCRTRNSHEIKIIDFGLAQRLTDNTPVRVLFGTPEFIPPEIINYEPIGFQSDMWSVGVICYVLLSGLSPFMGDSDVDTFTNITRADYDFEDEAFDAVSQDAKEFISGLLIHRKEDRLTTEECLNSKWLSLANDNVSNVKLSTDKLKKFIIRRKWQISQIDLQQTHQVLAGRQVG